VFLVVPVIPFEEAIVILEVKHLRLVDAVANYGSLTNASKHLHLTQSALSHQLNELERRLGIPLFHRVGRRLVPTVAGEQLMGAAKQALTVLRGAERSLRRLAAGEEAVLRLTTECYTAYHWLPPILEEFARRCPKVEVQIVAQAARFPIRSLLAGKVDVAVMHDVPADDRVQAIPLFEDDMLVVVAPGHSLAGEPFVCAEDFADEHLLMYTASTSDSVLFNRVLGPAGITPRRISAIQLTEAILEMVKAGLGISVLARWAVEPLLREGTIAARPLTRDGLRRQWSAVVLKQASTPLYIREFCRLLVPGPAALSSPHPATADARQDESVEPASATMRSVVRTHWAG
jgi:LysR family transcriptional regulator for metE and metH